MTEPKVNAPEENIDVLRQILFGQEQRQFEQKFKQLSERLDQLIGQTDRAQAELIQKMQWQENALLNQITQLQAAHKTSLDALTEKITVLQDASELMKTQHNALSRELTAQGTSNHTAMDSKFAAFMLQNKTLMSGHQTMLEQALQQTKSMQASELNFKTKLKQLASEFIDSPNKHN
jgi:phosphoglycerate-specific signal transduction histidine kinase